MKMSVTNSPSTAKQLWRWKENTDKWKIRFNIDLDLKLKQIFLDFDMKKFSVKNILLLTQEKKRKKKKKPWQIIFLTLS